MPAPSCMRIVRLTEPEFEEQLGQGSLTSIKGHANLPQLQVHRSVRSTARTSRRPPLPRRQHHRHGCRRVVKSLCQLMVRRRGRQPQRHHRNPRRDLRCSLQCRQCHRGSQVGTTHGRRRQHRGPNDCSASQCRRVAKRCHSRNSLQWSELHLGMCAAVHPLWQLVVGCQLVHWCPSDVPIDC